MHEEKENMNEAEDPASAVSDAGDSTESEQNGGRRSQFIAGFVVIAIVLGGFLVWHFYLSPASTTDSEAPAESEVVVSVRTAKVERQTVSAEVSAVGTIFPVRQAAVSSNTSGQIRGLQILKDKFVRKGELLAKINTSDLEAQKREAEATLKEARLNVQALRRSTIPQAEIQVAKDLRDARAAVENARNLYDRRKDLYDKGGIALKDVEEARLSLTQAENNLKFLESSSHLRTGTSNPLDLQTAEARVQQAEQRVNTLQTQIGLAEIRAPISGFVIEQVQFDGEYASPGGKILTIADTGEVIVKANFPDTVIPELKVGDAVSIYPNDLAGERMSGNVSLISRSTDPNNRTSEVWVNLGNGAGRLRSGAAANFVISESAQKDAVVVPNAAVVLDAANEKSGVVMVVDKLDTAHEVKVEIGIRTNDLTQIVSGLSGGETVVVEGNYALPDGVRVEVKSDEAKPGDGN